MTSWGDLEIDVTLPSTGPQVPLCSVQQQAQYGGSSARCGEIVITSGNGKKSVDTVTLTIGGKAPTRMAQGDSIQAAIDAAQPGDLIIVPPGVYHELLVMWKPVRLQGVGAASVIIDANAHPSQALDAWRRRVVCLFGLAPNGVPDGWNASCANSWAAHTGFNATTSNPQVDRLPLEAVLGWDTTQSGNLAEQLQEPSLLGAYEGAGITVLAKGVRVRPGANPWTDGLEVAAFPAGTTLLNNGTGSLRGNPSGCGPNTATATNPFPSSFQCNPSRIDGLTVMNSSQGGGGIFVHGWAHNLEIANNRVTNNQGTLAGGITDRPGRTSTCLSGGSR